MCRDTSVDQRVLLLRSPMPHRYASPPAALLCRRPGFIAGVSRHSQRTLRGNLSLVPIGRGSPHNERYIMSGASPDRCGVRTSHWRPPDLEPDVWRGATEFATCMARGLQPSRFAFQEPGPADCATLLADEVRCRLTGSDDACSRLALRRRHAVDTSRLPWAPKPAYVTALALQRRLPYQVETERRTGVRVAVPPMSFGLPPPPPPSSASSAAAGSGSSSARWSDNSSSSSRSRSNQSPPPPPPPPSSGVSLSVPAKLAWHAGLRRGAVDDHIRNEQAVRGLQL